MGERARAGYDASSAAHVRRLVVAALRDPPRIVELPLRELDLLLRVLRRARLLARIGCQLREARLLDALPRAAVDHLLGALVNAEAQRRVALWELDRVMHALRDDPPAPIVVLKGCAYTLAGLPNARGRFFADVDLLVQRERLLAVETQLRARGWQAAPLDAHDERYYRAWSHELPPLRHVDRRVEVDLHHNIVMSTARVKPDARLLLGNVRPMPGTALHVLSPIDMTLHAMTHLMSSSDLADALRELVDIDELLRHFCAHEPGFWDGFWPRAEALDLARPAFHALRQAHRCLGTPIPSALLASSRTGAPPRPVVRLTDVLMPLALFPLHPDATNRRARAARVVLYLRSHWIRMPPLMLARHLARKLMVRRRAAQAARASAAGRPPAEDGSRAARAPKRPPEESRA